MVVVIGPEPVHEVTVTPWKLTVERSPLIDSPGPCRRMSATSGAVIESDVPGAWTIEAWRTNRPPGATSIHPESLTSQASSGSVTAEPGMGTLRTIWRPTMRSMCCWRMTTSRPVVGDGAPAPAFGATTAGSAVPGDVGPAVPGAAAAAADRAVPAHTNGATTVTASASSAADNLFALEPVIRRP